VNCYVINGNVYMLLLWSIVVWCVCVCVLAGFYAVVYMVHSITARDSMYYCSLPYFVCRLMLLTVLRC